MFERVRYRTIHLGKDTSCMTDVSLKHSSFFLKAPFEIIEDGILKKKKKKKKKNEQNKA